MQKTCCAAFRALFIVFVICSAGTARADNSPAAANVSSKIEILAWMGPPATVDRMTEMKEAGFTISFNNFASPDAAIAGLDAARQAGVKLLVSCPQLETDPQATAQRLKSHPALAGYFLRDEPPASLFSKLADWLKKVRGEDPDHNCYINLFPNYATADQLGVATYQKYLDDFLKTVPVPYLSFDHYPVIQDGNKPPTLRSEWYENLEQASAAARRTDIPLWAFALSTRHYSYPTPTIAHLRVQVFSDLAYGAQTIQYFTYWQVGGNDPPFNDAPVGMDGKRTPVYNRVKQLNQEIRGLAAVFAGSRVLSIGHTGVSIPRGTRRYEPQSPVVELKTQEQGDSGAVVSVLTKGDRRFLVLVNRDINQPLPIEIRFKDSPTSAAIELMEKDGTTKAIPDSNVRATLEPGNIAVWTWTQMKPQK